MVTIIALRAIMSHSHLSCLPSPKNAACQLVNADRGSLFLVDHEKEELYARIFDQENRSPSVDLTHDWVMARTRSVRAEDTDVDAMTLLRWGILYDL